MAAIRQLVAMLMPCSARQLPADVVPGSCGIKVSAAGHSASTAVATPSAPAAVPAGELLYGAMHGAVIKQLQAGSLP